MTIDQPKLLGVFWALTSPPSQSNECHMADFPVLLKFCPAIEVDDRIPMTAEMDDLVLKGFTPVAVARWLDKDRNCSAIFRSENIAPNIIATLVEHGHEVMWSVINEHKPECVSSHSLYD